MTTKKGIIEAKKKRIDSLRGYKDPTRILKSNKPCKKCGKMSSDKHYTCIHDFLGS